MEKSYQNMNAENRTAKYLKYLCEHEKYKYQCKECGGRLKYALITGENLNAKSAKGLKYALMNRHININAKSAEGLKYAPITDKKLTCKECGGTQVCPHNRQKSRCKKCSDPIKVNIEQWIFNRRQYDKMNNIYDADRFIDKCFLKGLVEDYKQCYYGDCKVNFQYTEYQNDLATIERLDNSIGHIKSNCVLCCLKCNNSKKSKKSSAHDLIYFE